MDQPQPAIRQPNGDLLIPASTAELLQHLLHCVQRDLGKLHGQSCVEPGHMETRNETAYRQAFVDKLSASVGVTPPTVMGRQMPDSHYLVNGSEVLDGLQAISRLLFSEP